VGGGKRTWPVRSQNATLWVPHEGMEPKKIQFPQLTSFRREKKKSVRLPISLTVKEMVVRSKKKTDTELTNRNRKGTLFNQVQPWY